jgi:integrase
MACAIRTNRHGYLAYRLRWNGLESHEGTGLRNTPGNRAKLEARARVISDEMKTGTFDYLRWFPRGHLAGQFGPVERSRVMLHEYADTWLARKEPPLVRASLGKTYTKHLRHILPAFRHMSLSDVTPAALERFRQELLKKGLAVKTVRDIIDATFRALYRDARTIDGLVGGDPFAALKWPRPPRQPPDPFTEEERDVLIDHFRRRDPRYHPFVATLFWTGLRTSEAVGLRWGDVDLRSGKLSVRRSRTLGEDNAPKTAGSERTITLVIAVVKLLAGLKPLHAADDDFVFVSRSGLPMQSERWVIQHWRRALRATNIRPRKFYATRHTFISAGLAAGVNTTWLADYCGTSGEMIERHYGRYLRDDTPAQLAKLTGNLAGTLPKAKRQVMRMVGGIASGGGEIRTPEGF